MMNNPDNPQQVTSSDVAFTQITPLVQKTFGSYDYPQRERVRRQTSCRCTYPFPLFPKNIFLPPSSAISIPPDAFISDVMY